MTDLERAVEIFAAVQFVVIGVSHIVQPRVWVDFFVWLRSKGHAGVFVNGFLSLGFGSIIVAFHNVWSGLPMILTIIGWGQIAKATLSFVAPRIGMRSLERVSPDRAREFVVPGVFFVAVGAMLGYLVLTG